MDCCSLERERLAKNQLKFVCQWLWQCELLNAAADRNQTWNRSQQRYQSKGKSIKPLPPVTLLASVSKNRAKTTIVDGFVIQRIRHWQGQWHPRVILRLLIAADLS